MSISKYKSAFARLVRFITQSEAEDGTLARLFKWSPQRVHQASRKAIYANTTTTDPTVNDDVDDGYFVGSRWLNTSTSEEWVCFDTTAGAAVWILSAGGGISGPGGSDTHVQYNDNGAFGGDAAFTFDDSTQEVTIGDGTAFPQLTIDSSGSFASQINFYNAGSPEAYIQGDTSGALILNTTHTSGSLIVSGSAAWDWWADRFVGGGTGARLKQNTITLADPGFCRADDTDTGLCFGGSDTLALTTGGSQAISVDASQNVTLDAYGSGSITDTKTYDIGVDSAGKVIEFKQEYNRSITVASPTASEDVSWFFTNVAITVTEMRCVLRGSSTPSVTWTVKHSTDRSAAGNEVVTGGTTTTSTTTGSDVTSFNDETIPADSFVWVETTAQSGTVDEKNLSLFYTID